MAEPPVPNSKEGAFDAAFAEFYDAWQSGDMPDVDEFCAQHMRWETKTSQLFHELRGKGSNIFFCDSAFFSPDRKKILIAFGGPVAAMMSFLPSRISTQVKFNNWVSAKKVIAALNDDTGKYYTFAKSCIHTKEYEKSIEQWKAHLESLESLIIRTEEH